MWALHNLEVETPIRMFSAQNIEIDMKGRQHLSSGKLVAGDLTMGMFVPESIGRNLTASVKIVRIAHHNFLRGGRDYEEEYYGKSPEENHST